jgi:hypothetical protein
MRHHVVERCIGERFREHQETVVLHLQIMSAAVAPSKLKAGSTALASSRMRTPT